jgi:hypothetical protein
MFQSLNKYAKYIYTQQLKYLVSDTQMTYIWKT